MEIWKRSAARIIGQQRRRYTQLPSSLFILRIFLFDIFFSHTFVEFCVYYRAQSTNSTSSQDVGYNREKKKKKKTLLFYLFSFDFLVATLPCSYRQMFPNSIFCVITCCGGWWWLGRAQQQHAKECGIQTTRVRKLLVAAFDARTERGRLFGVWATTRQWTRQRIKRLPSPANALR